METREDRALARRVQDVRRRLESWRASRGKGRRIPEPLWQAAVRLAQAQGVNPIARALRLDYYDLKGRLAALETQGPVAGTAPDGGGASPFVKFDIPAAGASAECSVEMVDCSGARVSVRLSNSDAVDVVRLAQAFWGARR